MSAQIASTNLWSYPHLIAHTVLDSVIGPRLRSQAGQAWRRWRKRNALAQAERRIVEILPLLPAEPGAPPPATWTIQRLDWTEADVAVAMVGPAGEPGSLILKLPYTPASVASLRRQAAVLDQLHAHQPLGTWRSLLPRTLPSGDALGQPVFAETALPGLDMGAVLRQPDTRLMAYRSAVAAIRRLHLRTGRRTVVDGEILRRWVEAPVRVLRKQVRNQPALDRLEDELYTGLAGQNVSVSWIHGDFWPRNLLVPDDRTTLTGIVDWDLAEPGELPMHDILNLLLATPQLVHGRGLGEVVRGHLEGMPWSDERHAILDEAWHAVLPNVSERTLLLLYWLRFVTTYLRKCPDRARAGWWMNANVELVLQTIGGGA